MLKTLLDYGMIDPLEEEEELLKTDGRGISETSRESYHELMSHPHEVNGRHREYLETLYNLEHPATDQEVSRAGNHKDPNYLRPRRYELAGYDSHFPDLVRSPLIKVCPKRKCKVTGKTAMTWWFTNAGLKLVEQWRLTS